jgi:hypothetical protein
VRARLSLGPVRADGRPATGGRGSRWVSITTDTEKPTLLSYESDGQRGGIIGHPVTGPDQLAHLVVAVLVRWTEPSEADPENSDIDEVNHLKAGHFPEFC